MKGATILVVAHRNGRFAAGEYLIAGLFPFWEDAGHRVVVREGLDDLPRADVVIQHVDLSVVPQEYSEALAHYPRVVNGGALDARKRGFSENLLERGADYRGRVIVKTDLNCSGLPEAFHRKVALEEGRPPGPPVHFMRSRYPVFESLSAVPKEVWSDPDLVVEKFLPELDERGYALRHWIFFGDHERCSRVVGPQPVVKGADVLERKAVPVPEELRAWRSRLRLDYGKLDFVLHEGRPVLLDVNRTPTLGPRIRELAQAGMQEWAKGLGAFLS